MVMHVASRARLHVWQNRSHITLCIQTSHRHRLIEHTLRRCQVALKLLWIQGLSRIWWMGCVLTLAMNNIFGPCSCRGYNEQFGNCARLPASLPWWTVLENSKPLPPTVEGLAPASLAQQRKIGRPLPQGNNRPAQRGTWPMTLGRGETVGKNSFLTISLKEINGPNCKP